MFKLTRSGLSVDSSPERIQALRERLVEQGGVLLPNLLADDLQSLIAPILANACFRPGSYEGIGDELLMDENAALATLMFLVNDRRLLALIETLLGRTGINSFVGRISRMSPGASQGFDWHDDAEEELDRYATLSVGLNPEPWSGGCLQIRRRDSAAITFESPPLRWGDALLFLVDVGFEHRVTQVTGELPKTSFVGWFRGKPGLPDRLRSRG